MLNILIGGILTNQPTDRITLTTARAGDCRAKLLLAAVCRKDRYTQTDKQTSERARIQFAATADQGPDQKTEFAETGVPVRVPRNRKEEGKGKQKFQRSHARQNSDTTVLYDGDDLHTLSASSVGKMPFTSLLVHRRANDNETSCTLLHTR